MRLNHCSLDLTARTQFVEEHALLALDQNGSNLLIFSVRYSFIYSLQYSLVNLRNTIVKQTRILSKYGIVSLKDLICMLHSRSAAHSPTLTQSGAI